MFFHRKLLMYEVLIYIFLHYKVTGLRKENRNNERTELPPSFFPYGSNRTINVNNTDLCIRTIIESIVKNRIIAYNMEKNESAQLFSNYRKEYFEVTGNISKNLITLIASLERLVNLLNEDDISSDTNAKKPNTICETTTSTHILTSSDTNTIKPNCETKKPTNTLASILLIIIILIIVYVIYLHITRSVYN